MNRISRQPGRFPRRSSQSGVALIVSLIMLVLLLLLGLTAMQTTTMEESMAGNMQDRMVAFQAAEASLRDGEEWLLELGEEPDVVDTCGATPCDVWTLDAAGLGELTERDHSWWLTNAREYSDTISLAESEPQYVIEFQAYVPDGLGRGHNYPGPSGRHYYRVTARGTGGSDNAEAVVRSTVAKPFN